MTSNGGAAFNTRNGQRTLRVFTASGTDLLPPIVAPTSDGVSSSNGIVIVR